MKLLTRIASPLVLAAVVLSAAVVAQAQPTAQAGDQKNQTQAGVQGPAQAAWSIRFDLPKFAASPVGKHLLGKVEQNPQNKGKLDAFSKKMGIDVTKDIGPAVLYGRGFEAKSITLMVQLGDSLGNIPDKIKELPGYQSQSSDGMTVHSFMMRQPGGTVQGPGAAPDAGAGQEHRVFLAFPKAADGKYMLVASPDRGRVTHKAGQAAGGREMMPEAADLSGPTVLKAHVGDLTHTNLPGNPRATNMARWIKNLNLSLASTQRFKLDLHVTADNAAHARQLGQIVQVMKMRMNRGGPGQSSPAAEVGQQLQVQHDQGSAQVAASLDVSADKVEGMIDNAKKPHGPRAPARQPAAPAHPSGPGGSQPQ